MNQLLNWGATLLIAFAVGLIPVSDTFADTFENYSAVGGNTERAPNRKKGKGCTNYYFCGPTSTIELTMLTSGDVSLNYDVGENGTFEKMMKYGEDFQKSGVLSLTDKILKKKAEHEAQKITIVLPMIDYGYSGTFNNVKISVTEKNETFTSAKRDEYSGMYSEFTGSVTIEEYSPYNMAGTYSGTLYSYVETNAPYRGPSPDQQVKQFKIDRNGSINGEFNILSPWEDDDRMNEGIDFQSAMVDPMKNDIKKLAAQYGIDVDVDKEFEQVEANARQNERGSSSSSNIYGDCNCSCNFIQSATPTCQTSCRAAFDVCKGDRYTPPVRQTYINNDELSPELQEAAENFTLKDGEKFMNLDQETIDRFEDDAVKTPTNLRDKFIVLLEKQQPGPDNAPARAMMLQGFDSMPDDKSKMVMFISLGGKE